MIIVVTTNNMIEIKELDEVNYFSLGKIINTRKIDPIRSMKVKNISSDHLFFGIDSDGAINKVPFSKFATDLSKGYDLYGDVVVCKELDNYDLIGFDNPKEVAEVILQLVSAYPYLEISFVSDEPSIDVIRNEKSIISDATYLTFGKYPQSLVLDDSLIKELDACSNITDKGYVKYHGLEYQRIPMPINTSISYDKGPLNLVKGKNYYYLVEPITWEVLYDGEDTLLLSDKVIDYYYYNKQVKTYNDSNINENDYFFSDIRRFLNRYFYNKAFSRSEKERINNIIASNEFEEKVSLVSKDITLYIDHFEGYATDYAATLGCEDINKKRLTSWWLKTPGNTSSEVLAIASEKEPISKMCSQKKCGIRPMIHISK